MYFETALKAFNHVADIVNGKAEPTQVVEITNQPPLNSIKKINNALIKYEMNTPIWQHNETSHIVAERIAAGTGYMFNRNITNIYADSKLKCKDERAFRKLWRKTNGTLQGNGKIPKATEATSDLRVNEQKSYIIANQAHGLLDTDPYHGKVAVDRTHLIPASVTGIEVSPGLIIDFNSNLNRYEMENFETQVLKINRSIPIEWITVVSFTPDGFLYVKYIILDLNIGKIIRKEKFIDKSWDYLWFS